MLGGIAAALLLVIVAKSKQGGYDLTEESLGVNGYGDHSPDGYKLLGALIIEIVLTALLVFTVLAATDKIANVAFAGIPIGLVLVLIHLVGIPVDNLSVNPARSIGPALFAGGSALGQLWLFIIGAAGRRGRRRPPARGACSRTASRSTAEESAVAAEKPAAGPRR